MKNKFNPGSIKKQIEEQHKKQWAWYVKWRDGRREDSDAFAAVSELSNLKESIMKTSEVNGAVKFSIDKVAVEDIVQDTLLQEIEAIYGDIAMRETRR